MAVWREVKEALPDFTVPTDYAEMPEARAKRNHAIALYLVAHADVDYSAAENYAETAEAQAARLFPDDEFSRLVLLISQLVAPAASQVSDLASSLVGLESLPPIDPKLIAILQRSGSRIVDITQETRAAVQRTLAEGAAKGYSDYQVATGVANDGFRGIRDVVAETYKDRAQAIARTETAISSAFAAGDRYTDAGVTEVDCIDNPECGMDGHDDPEKPNGKRYSIDTIDMYPISHPRCVRVWLPVVASRAA